MYAKPKVEKEKESGAGRKRRRKKKKGSLENKQSWTAKLTYIARISSQKVKHTS